MQGKGAAVAAEGSNKWFAYLCCVVGQEWESQELCNRVGSVPTYQSRSHGKGPQDSGRAPGHVVALMEALLL